MFGLIDSSRSPIVFKYVTIIREAREAVLEARSKQGVLTGRTLTRARSAQEPKQEDELIVLKFEPFEFDSTQRVGVPCINIYIANSTQYSQDQTQTTQTPPKHHP